MTLSNNEIPHLYQAIENLVNTADPRVARVLDRALSGAEITVDEGELLFDVEGPGLMALMATADVLRRKANGDTVTYVVNRNINFTNVCIKHCGFCAFSRDHREEEGYLLPLNEIIRRAQEAWDLGATEICVQAGLPPKMNGSLYIDLTREIKKAIPEMHIHGFSPEEILYGSIRSKSTIQEYLQGLKEAGIGSLPGTSAEILVQEVRDKISPGRISVEQWKNVILTAHKIGIPTTSTIMFGHVETYRERALHLDIIRNIQKEYFGITEFVPLSFVHNEAPMWQQNLVEGIQPGATGLDVVKMHAIARIMLNNFIDNIQCSWVKEGPKLAQMLLASGCNDIGGTLINESISTSAGAQFGQLVPPTELRHWIRDMGRVPARRSTLYKVEQVYEEEPLNQEPLDIAALDPHQFGSYDQLIKLTPFRYEGQRAPSLKGPTLPEAIKIDMETKGLEVV